MTGDTQSRHCLWLMLVVSLAHSSAGQAVGAGPLPGCCYSTCGKIGFLGVNVTHQAAPTGGGEPGTISARLTRGGIGAVGRTCRWRVSPAARSVRHRGQEGWSPRRSCKSGWLSRSRGGWLTTRMAGLRERRVGLDDVEVQRRTQRRPGRRDRTAVVLERPADQAVMAAGPRQGVEYRGHVATVALGR